MIGLCNRCGRSHELDTSALMCGSFTTVYGAYPVTFAPPCAKCVSLELELAEARGGLQMAYEKGQEARDSYLALYDDMLMLANGKPLDDEADKNALVVQAQLAAARAELNAARQACNDEHPEVGQVYADLAAARAEAERLTKELAQLREWHAAASKVMSDYVRDATPAITEVERAFRAGYEAAFDPDADSRDGDAAWARYQQERERGDD